MTQHEHEEAGSRALAERGHEPDLGKRESGRALFGVLFRAFGGYRGLFESGLPGLAFGLAYGWGGSNLTVALVAALAMGIVMLLLRLLRRQTPLFALIGFAGGVAAGGVAWVTGNPKDYYLPSVMTNAVVAMIFLATIIARKPIVGYLLAIVLNDSRMTWRGDPVRRRAYTLATAAWAVMYTMRAAGRAYLYYTASVSGLAVLRYALDWPLLFATLIATYLAVRRVPSLTPPNDHDEGPVSCVFFFWRKSSSGEHATESPGGDRDDGGRN